MKILVIANSLLALPTLETLIKENKVVSIGLSSLNHEAKERIALMAKNNQIPTQTFFKDSLAQDLEKWIKDYQADVVFVLTFTYKIPSAVLNTPPYGFYNFHFGLLPQYRGADAIFWQIRNQEKYGGISVHQMDEKFDRGPIAFIEKLPLSPEATYGMHLTQLAFAAVGVVKKLVDYLEANDGEIDLKPQVEEEGHYYPRPVAEHIIIDWEKQDIKEIKAIVKASNPFLKGGITMLRGIPIRVLEVSEMQVAQAKQMNEEPGTIISINPQHGLLVFCKDKKVLRLDILFLEEGYMTGLGLQRLGVQPGERFQNFNN